MTPDYFQQKSAYNNKKDANVIVSKSFQGFLGKLPIIYEPKIDRIAKVIKQDGSIQSSN
ncbi:hypothetical protein [Pseudanabaena phage PA-SR01]|nr:hypothetical protein [Pseudanabaena phage PA-SR01]